MNWNNLKLMLCPKCTANIIGDSKFLPLSYKCVRQGCDFYIGIARFNEIVNSMYSKKPSQKAFDDNLGDLNNLGRDEMTRDFSDSPHLNI